MATASPKQKRNIRRTTTNASDTGEWDVSLDESHIAAMKSKLSSKDFLLSALKQLILINSDDEALHLDLAEHMALTVYKPGEVIREVGHAREEMLLVYKGQLELVDDEGGAVSVLGPGGVLGEVCLVMDNRKYTARLLAKTPLELFSLPNAKARHVLEKHKALPSATDLGTRLARAEDVIAELVIFKPCHRTFSEALTMHLQPVSYKAGELVIKQGTLGKEMYVILDGIVETLQANGDDVATVHEAGAPHGEVALLKNARRGVSLRAQTDASGFKLTQSDYEEVVSNHEDYRELILAAEHERLNNRTESTLPLHMAARTGQEVFVEKVLGKGKGAAMVNLKDDLGWTALHEAVHSGHLHICKFLAKKGARIEEKNGEGNTPIHLAAMDGYADIVEWLCGLGVDVEAYNENDSTPLHMAARCGVVECCQALIDNGARVDSTDLSGNTPLHFAANVGQVNCVKLLLEKGAKVNEANSDQVTPLHQGALSDNFDCVTYLIEAGADVNAVDNEGATPLQFGANVSAVESCRALLAKDANPNARDMNGHIPLHHSAFNGSLQCVKLMLKYGGKKTTKGNDGMTPYMFAELGGYDEIAKILYFYESPLVMAIRADDYPEA